MKITNNPIAITKSRQCLIAFLGSCLLFFSVQANAHDFKLGLMTIAHPFIRINTGCASDTTHAQIMLVINQGKQIDKLVGARIEGRHTGKLMAANKQKILEEIAAIELPARNDKALTLPYYAIEFPTPATQWQPGTTVQGSLKFERAGTANISFMVESGQQADKSCGSQTQPSKIPKPAGSHGADHAHKM